MSERENPAAVKLFKIRKTVLAMLKARSYSVPASDLDQTWDSFKEKISSTPTAKLGDAVTILVSKADVSIFVFFAEDEKLGVSAIRKYCERMEREDIKRAIIVLQKGISPMAKTILGELAPRYMVETFNESDLLVNITEHNLVPKHELLSEDDKKKLLDKYKLKEIQLPRMQMSDPVARFYGLQRGNVVKIERNSETAGGYVIVLSCL